MAILYSNELKAVVIPDDFQNNPLNVLKDKCLTIQHFDYNCVYKRNDSAELYGSMEPVTLKFTIRVNSMSQARIFYKSLVANAFFDFTFLFNPTFNANQRMSDYDDGMVINGYVVGIEQDFNSSKSKNGEDVQIQLEVSILARSVVYLGRDESSNLKSEFIK